MKNLIKVFLTVISVLPMTSNFAQDWEKVVDIRGYWKFNIGDDIKWAEYNYNDKNWEEIRVPSSWEDEGYHGYNGYAWYRTTFSLPKDLANNNLYIALGYIDDVDEVYLNGKIIGATGSFPPNFRTAYNANRRYAVSKELFYTNKVNVLSVRVYDSQLAGGIISGDISIQILESANLNIALDGTWKFNIGDNLAWKESDFNDKNWTNVMVPSKWEVQGYLDYDGFAWYRKTFYADMSLDDEKLVLLLGKIDDIDQCYLNGKLIGSTGDFVTTPKYNNFNDEWLAERGYYIPQDLMKFGEENVIAVRVYDGLLDGGIYQGPIGITTQNEYRKYWKDKKRRKGFWETIFEDIMH